MIPSSKACHLMWFVRTAYVRHMFSLCVDVLDREPRESSIAQAPYMWFNNVVVALRRRLLAEGGFGTKI